MEDSDFQIDGYKPKTFHPGEKLLQEGTPPSAVYILKEGEVEVLSGTTHMEILDQPGTLLGEIAFMLQCDHTASVVAITETTVYVIDNFLTYLAKEPETIRDVCRLIRLRLINSPQKGLENLPLDLQLSGCKIENFPQNTVVVTEGESADKIFVLQSGTVKAISCGNVIFRGNSPGTMFGEISNLTGKKYSISVLAVTKCTFCVINDVAEFFQTNPLASLQVARVLAKRLNSLVDQFTEFRVELMRNHLQKGNKKFSSKLDQFDKLLKRDIMNPFSDR